MADIPTDILQEIFKDCFSRPLRPCFSQFPWYLGHVCSRWRALFLSMRSTFWNRIEIEWHDDYGPLMPEQFATVQEIVAFFLDCARGAPFSLAFGVESKGECDIDSDNIRPTFMELLNHSEQWEELSIHLSPTELALFCAVKGRLPLLNNLEIGLARDIDYQRTPSITPSMVTNIFEDAPLLTQVTLWDIATRRFKFNWSSMTIVRFLDSLAPQTLLAVLRETINLVELTIEAWPALKLGGGGRGPIYFPLLERLSVNSMTLLTILKTPSLQRLKIDFFHYDESPADLNKAVGIVVAFLRRWEIKLGTLVISHGHAAAIKEILLLTPKLHRLILFRISDIADVFKWLAGTGTEELRFNDLEMLCTYSNSTNKEEGLEALHDMITRRNPPGDAKGPSPREVILRAPDCGQSLAGNLKLLCRDKGIWFGFVEGMSTFPWGIDHRELYD